MVRFIVLAVLATLIPNLVSADHHLLVSDVEVSDVAVCLEGYLMDNACANANFLMDKKTKEQKTVVALTCPGPAIHSFMCMLAAPCYDSGYVLLKALENDEYVPHVQLQNGRDLVKAEIIRVGECDETAANCEESKSSGMYATVCGIIISVGNVNTMNVTNVTGEAKPMVQNDCENKEEDENKGEDENKEEDGNSGANMITSFLSSVGTLIVGLALL